jgi:MerR family mercuric resistance operon transcriptional regulator
MTVLTIGQLADTVGVPVSTLRFYERAGLLRPDARTASNYRTYSPATVERLTFIRAAQGSGFNLSDIAEMLALAHSDDPPCAELVALIDHRLGDVRKRLRDLKRVERALVRARTSCCRGEPDWCREIERLKGRKYENCPPSSCTACEAAPKNSRRRA